jgi:AraC-like DNA-binding protein
MAHFIAHASDRENQLNCAAMSRRLLDNLRQHVLPALASGAGALLPCDERVVADNNFQQAYTQDEFQHRHTEWFWLLRGRSHMKIGAQIYSLHPGDSCFLPPMTWHCDVYTGSTPAYESLWFSLRDEQLSMNHFAYRPIGDWSVNAALTATAPCEFSPLLTALQNETSHAAPFSKTICDGLMLQLAGIVARWLAEQESGDAATNTDTISQRVLEYLQMHYAEEVTLRDVAHAVYITPNYLTAVFKKETGGTIIEALTEIRLRHARRLLLENRRTVTAVAHAVGYENAAYFSRVFQRHVGTSPKSYSQSQKIPSE